MIIKSADFLGSFEKLEQCPQTTMPEFTFIGRSNVGKSSLINYVTGVKGLAKTSQTPGKTKLLNFFLINEYWRLVDLPGYGYAKLSKTEKARISAMIKEYILEREFLNTVFLLIDSRVPPQKIDLEFTTWLGENGIPFVIVFTKTDKVKVTYMEEFKTKMLETWEELPQTFSTSAERKTGKEPILNFIETCIAEIDND
jgi:GTP-binding protein